ncbi:hypothetical protein SAMN05444360_11777 [Chryseobacterium carnipullorum]|uniref:hypothetical protein n=1 Tax=Chryseobacterium carnipullorum TaxID=1124835 RepID=UPI000914EABB|nr:hypothetical protein [Chryseobacterium carnipullorum]SHM77832.1 hypothetical protein SAMN05444360_11777 [Chryseobacterium carnipullorum]
MIKIITTIIAVYLLYYAGNFVYDLFLKKDNSGRPEETEEYSLMEFSEKDKNEIQQVGIDDVENINTPNSFNQKELSPSNQEMQDETRDLDHFRKKFESEQDIDDYNNIPEISERTKENNHKETASLDSAQIENQNQEKKEAESPKLKSFHRQFKNFLNLAETNVQVLSDRDGYKVYQSMI